MARLKLRIIPNWEEEISGEVFTDAAIFYKNDIYWIQDGLSYRMWKIMELVTVQLLFRRST